MNPTTTRKQEALQRAFRHETPNYMLDCLSVIVALLTSPEKQERESGKRRVRELVKIGSNLISADQNAGDLANFANRHEP